MRSPRKLRGCVVTPRPHPPLQVESLAGGAGLRHIGSTESWPLDHQGSPEKAFLKAEPASKTCSDEK